MFTKMSTLFGTVKCLRVMLATFVVTIGGVASAAPIPITSYDIDQTPVSGFGCWFHNFTGTKTDTGRTVSGSVNCSPDGVGYVFNYANGSGTLNDGVFDTTHLLLTRNDNSGSPLQPVIRLNLDGAYKINGISLLKGNKSFTNITKVTVEINGTAVPVIPTPIGGDPLSVRLNLSGTGLELQSTTQITLKSFSASFFGNSIDQFGIGEIVVDGSNNASPVCVAAQAFPSVIWAPNQQFVPIVIMGVTDPDGDSTTIAVTGVTQDEPVKVEGNDATSPDAVIEAGAALVRAERLGSGNGRVYQVSFKAEDGKGGSCTGIVQVSVPHSLQMGLVAIDDGQLYDSTLP